MEVGKHDLIEKKIEGLKAEDTVRSTNIPQVIQECMKKAEAIVESSLLRFRPVVMTTLSTLLGAIPLILSSGAGAESRFAMAIVVFGGIGLASFITLYLIPALYILIEKDD